MEKYKAQRNIQKEPPPPLNTRRTKTLSKYEKGNVLFLILIAVALFAALSFAVVQSSQGGNSSGEEEAKIEQAIIDGYSAAINGGEMRLRLINKCTSIDYTPPAGWGSEDKTCHMFHPDGGMVAWLDLGLGAGCDLENLGLGASCNNVTYAGTSGSNRLYTTNGDTASVKWSQEYTNTSSGSTSDGLTNTNELVTRTDTSYYAANQCRALGDEWYLPSREELNALYANKDTGTLAGTFSGTYWSSTERSDNSTQAFRINFDTGAIDSAQKKNHTHKVRCVWRG